MSHAAYFILEGLRKECDTMQIGDILVNSLRNSGNGQTSNVLGTSCCGNNNQVAGVSTANLPNLGVNCCPTDSQVAGVSAAQLAGLGRDCCPTGNDVLGVSNERTIEVPEVLGIGEGNTFVEVCIPIVPPGLSILFNLIERSVVFDALVATNGKVFINGRLIKKIPFETCDTAVTPTAGQISRIVLSNVRAVTIEVPFALCINLRESVRGARVVVLKTNIDSVELPNLRCPEQPCIRSVTEKDCISVTVKVERDTIIRVPATTAL